MTRRPASRRRVVAIGLDAAELSLVERLAAAGELPEIGRILDVGTSATLATTRHHVAEVPWTEMLSGCTPQSTGYWSPIAYRPDYTLGEIAGFDFAEQRPFYAYCPGRSVIALDIPQSRLCPETAGLQVLGWGSHTQHGPSVSQPPGLLGDLTRRFGAHPAFPDDWMTVTETAAKRRPLEAAFLAGIERRTRICLELMARCDWDLAFVVFGETHAAGHNFWHLAQPDHPLARSEEAASDPIAAILRAVDRAIGTIRAAAPPETLVMLFAERGMKANSCDLPSFLFLPELLHRAAFGRPALAPGRPGQTGRTPPPDRQTAGDWGLALWSGQADGNALRRALRRHARAGLSRRFDRLFGGPNGLEHPYATPLGFLPPVWYRPLWPRMPAFALPSYSDGYVRINLKGREAKGIVEPADYARCCEAVTRLVAALTDPRSGRPIAADIARTRTNSEAMLADPRLPDADLVVTWREAPADAADSPEHGRIGPVPFRRSGDHTPRGFMALAGPGIPARRLPPARLVDVAPTILALLGLAVPAHLDGWPLVGEPAAAAAGAAADSVGDFR